MSDVDAFEARALAEVGLDLDAIPPRYRSRYFNHIFAGGYSAGLLLLHLERGARRRHGRVVRASTATDLRDAGDTFRTALLRRGGSVPEMEMLRGVPRSAAADRAAAAASGLLTG